MTTTKNRELIKIINGMDAMGYQVDFIEMLPERGFYPGTSQCLVNIKASPLIEVQYSEQPE